MAIETNTSIDVKTLTPFKKFIMTIGALPTSYLESMTYAEMLMWFCNYLQETVIPTVNNNAEAVQEVQELYNELKVYVNDYFENLDIQEEINNKLDEMALDGTLTTLIGAYVNPFIEQQNREIQAIDTKVTNIGSGAPIPVDSIADMMYTNRTYLLTTSGHWYYYDGTEWLDGGVYQATVDPDVTTVVNQFDISRNLYDPSGDTANSRIDASGNIVSDQLYSLTDFIYVGAGNTVTFKNWDDQLTGIGVAAWGVYNSNKQFGTRFTITSGQTKTTYTMPSGFDYLRFNVFSYNNPNYYKFSINPGTTLDDYMAYGEVKIKSSALPNKVISVDINGNGDYTTINSAVQNASAGDTILIYPGEYEESVEAWGKELHIVGLDRSSCILKNDTGTYSTPPIEMGAGSLENLTIIAEEGTSTDPNGWRDYAVHVEDNNLYGKDLNIINCKLVSYNSSALGMGLRGGSTVTIKDCELLGQSSHGGGLFFHDSASDSYTGTQNLNVINCDIRSVGTLEPTLKITSQCIEGATVNVRFLNTNVYNTNGSSYQVSSNNIDGTPSGQSYTGNPWRNLTNFNLTQDSYGNRLNTMNY